MKQRLLSLFAMLSLIVSGAMAQSLTVADITTEAGQEATITVAVEGAAEMTALQFNLSLPEGFTLAGDITLGAAAQGHTLSTNALASGDLLIVLYDLYQSTFTDGTLLTIPVVAAEEPSTTEGTLHKVRTATVAAQSKALSDVKFTAVVETPVVEVAGIALDQTAATLTEGETLTLTATVSPDDATDKTVTWETSDAAIATVVDGVVTAVAPGTATITAKAGDKKATCVVTVEKKVIAVSGITLDQTAATLTEGETLTLVATVSPDDATDKTITWATSDAAIATVVDGVVTAVAPGTATITAKAGDKEATCVVTVEAAAVEPTPEPEGLSTSKYYRVKNVTTGLYLQVEGNNTNMKLQNKAEGLAMMQIFGLEDAAEGMYYIKAADADNRYYAHASGWDFNATTNADNKTPFTIALVEGEEGVYTLHQSVALAGLAGADDSAAGSAIYCNKGIDNNGKWAFEALTAEEQAAYVATLTAAVKPALEAAIAHAEGVVANRSAVLSADEVATINAAVATAKAEKDNTADVDVLNALIDALNAAVDEAIYVWSIDELSNEVCYAVSTEDRGAWYSQSDNLTGTTKAGVVADVTDSKQQFAFVKSATTGAYYLYSVSEEKFVKVEGQYTALTEAPVQTVSFLNGTRSAKYPWVVALNVEDGQKQMGISNGYDPAIITFYNDLGDGGNTVRIEKVAAFDATAALAAIDALETGVEPSTLNSQPRSTTSLVAAWRTPPRESIL